MCCTFQYFTPLFLYRHRTSTGPFKTRHPHWHGPIRPLIPPCHVQAWCDIWGRVWCRGLHCEGDGRLWALLRQRPFLLRPLCKHIKKCLITAYTAAHPMTLSTPRPRSKGPSRIRTTFDVCTNANSPHAYEKKLAWLEVQDTSDQKNEKTNALVTIISCD